MKMESSPELRELRGQRPFVGVPRHDDQGSYMADGRDEENKHHSFNREAQRAHSNPGVSRLTDGQGLQNTLSQKGFSLTGNISSGLITERNRTHDTNTSETALEEENKEQNVKWLPAEETIIPKQLDDQLDQQRNTFAVGIRMTDGIATQPSLIPFGSTYDFHDSFHSHNIPTSRVDTQQARLGNRNIVTNITEGTFQKKPELYPANAAIYETNQGPDMGYSGHGHSSWRAQDSSTESKMDLPQQQIAGMEHERKERDDDSTTVRSADTASVGSPLLNPELNPGPIVQSVTLITAIGPQSTVTTPSTASTAPSTIDEFSLEALGHGALDRFALRGEILDNNALFHRRGQSWENLPYQSQLYVPDETDQGAYSRAGISLPQPDQGAWSNPHSSQRIATFRNEHGFMHGVVDPRWQQQQQQQQHQPRYENHAPHGSPRTIADNRGYGQAQPAHFIPYHATLRPQLGHMTQTTPPRGGRTPNRPSSAAPSGAPASQLQTGPTSGNPRSPSEVLKTLLRKKACLYEPDTSRAVALATWLVGRELALEFGYFSRQQLQAGVHACVASKIDSGVITRTKVNRCMQIILNSCFHYIIPRPDGTEENGDSFRFIFAGEVTDDMDLLRHLPAPWNDLLVERETVLEATYEEVETKAPRPGLNSSPSTPQASPRLGSIQMDKGSPKASKEEDDSKRAVLLCFNENVRCAEDVFRCHNEFIRDTAHASGLQLSSNEWRAFFGKEAAGSPNLWGNVGIPVPRLEGSHKLDALGVMTQTELAKFRICWCSKRYDHDHELCGFAHVEVNGGWLRRNTHVHNYGTEMCPEIFRFPIGRGHGNKKYVVNACPRGVNCGFAHSAEEIIFHPRRYKGVLCSSLTRPGGCPNGDVCPDFHPAESYKFPSKKGEGRLNSRQPRQGASSTKGAVQPPSPAPVLYCSPAPISRFEEQLQMPGLKNLYRRHCSVMRAYLSNPASCLCCYSCFGDDVGTGMDQAKLSETFTKRGLPQPRLV